MFLSNFISIYTYIYLHDIFLIENFYHAFRKKKKKKFLLNLHKIGSTYNIHVFEYIAAKFSHIFTNIFTYIFRTFRVSS